MLHRIPGAIVRALLRRHRRCQLCVTPAGQCYCSTHHYAWELGQQPACVAVI